MNLKGGKCSHLAKDFVCLLLMCSWLAYANLSEGSGWTVVDLFCGKGRISRLAAKVGFKTVSIDVMIPGAQNLARIGRARKKRRFPGCKRNLMDINGHSGFPLLGFDLCFFGPWFSKPFPFHFIPINPGVLCIPL
jgi:SAM-dependent methyltransferase